MAAVAVAVADRVVVAVVVVSAAAVTAAVAAPRAVASASGDQTVVAIGLLSKGCRRRCPESRVRVRNLAIGRDPVLRSAIGRVVLVDRAHRLATGQAVLVVRARRLAIAARVRAVRVARQWALVVCVRAARRR